MRWKNIVADLLSNTEWGEDFDRLEVELIAPLLMIRSYSKDQYIFREGDEDIYMAIICSGTVEILKSSARHEIVIAKMGAGTHFGELSLLDELPRSASAKAMEDTTLLILDKQGFMVILRDNPTLAVKIVMKIAKTVSARLRYTTSKYVYAWG